MRRRRPSKRSARTSSLRRNPGSSSRRPPRPDGAAARPKRPAGDFTTRRVQPHAADSTVEIAAQEGLRVADAIGVPCALLDPRAAGQTARDAWRRFVLSTCTPIGGLIADAATAVLEVPITLDYRHLLHADALSQRARAWRSFVGKDETMPAADAREIVGFP